MKRIAFFLVVALCALASMANAQQGMVLGGVLSIDKDRVEQARGVDFSLAAYDDISAVGNDMDLSGHLVGFHDAINGMYPTVPQGTWLDAVIDPTGFGRVEGVDYDPTGNLENDSKSWQACRLRRQGGYGVLIDTSNKLGPISFRFRIRHRDGRDRINFVIFTATWIRGGNLFTRFRLTVQKAPAGFDKLSGEDRLSYLRGFIPATATRSDAGTTSTQTVTVPPQTATQTVNTGTTNTGTGNTNSGKNEDVDYCSVVVGSFQLSTIDQPMQFDKPGRAEKALIDDARKHTFKPEVVEIKLDPAKTWILVSLSDSERFDVTLTRDGKAKDLRTSRNVFDKYETMIWARTEQLINSTLTIVDKKGRLRTVNFVADRPDGQGDKR